MSQRDTPPTHFGSRIENTSVSHLSGNLCGDVGQTGDEYLTSHIIFLIFAATVSEVVVWPWRCGDAHMADQKPKGSGGGRILQSSLPS